MAAHASSPTSQKDLEKFFQKLSLDPAPEDTRTIPTDALLQCMVEISFEAINLPKMKKIGGTTDPYLVWFEENLGAEEDKPDDKWEEKFKTEIINDEINPRWKTKLQIKGLSNNLLDRELRFEVYDKKKAGDIKKKELIGRVEGTSIYALASAKGQISEFNMTNKKLKKQPGLLRVALDVIPLTALSKENPRVDLKLGFPNAHEKLFYVLSRALAKGHYTPVYTSSVAKKDGIWDPVTLPLQEIIAGMPCREIRFEIWKYKATGSIRLGHVQTSFDSLRKAQVPLDLQWTPTEDAKNEKVLLSQLKESKVEKDVISLKIGFGTEHHNGEEKEEKSAKKKLPGLR